MHVENFYSLTRDQTRSLHCKGFLTTNCVEVPCQVLICVSWCWRTPHPPAGHQIAVFWNIFFQILDPLFKLGCLGFCHLRWSLLILDRNLFLKVYFANIFSPSTGSPFILMVPSMQSHYSLCLLFCYSQIQKKKTKTKNPSPRPFPFRLSGPAPLRARIPQFQLLSLKRLVGEAHRFFFTDAKSWILAWRLFSFPSSKIKSFWVISAGHVL